MKKWFVLIKTEILLACLWIIFGIGTEYCQIHFMRPDYMFEIQSRTDLNALWIVILSSFFQIFRFPRYWGKQSNSDFEFFFSRAISRKSIFLTRSFVYFFICLFPVITIWVHSNLHPLIRIELPYNSATYREETKQFYLTHFRGAQLQPNKHDKDIEYVALPNGRIDQAFLSSIWIGVYALLFQALGFILLQPKIRLWIQASVFIFFMFSMFFLEEWINFAGGSRSYYAVLLSWTNAHPFSVLAMLAALAVVVQIYCCRKFVKMEVIS